ncbi:HalOD1 output domain-containing protein [Haladaptatus sp. AB618]
MKSATLDGVLATHSTRTRNSATSISFTYTNYTVTADSTGTVHVAPV